MTIVSDRAPDSLGVVEPEPESTTRRFYDFTESVCDLLVKGDIDTLQRLTDLGLGKWFGNQTQYKRVDDFCPQIRRAPDPNIGRDSSTHLYRWYPLHVAVLTEDPALVRLLLDQPSVNVNVHDGKDVEESSSSNDSMWFLFGRPCRTTHRNVKGATPLHYACMVANAEIIKMLVDAGANILAQDERDRRPVDYFPVHERALDTISAFKAIEDSALKRKYKISTSYNVGTLHQALIDSDMLAFEAISESHPQLVTERTEYGWTLLHLAAIRNLRVFVKAILDHSTCSKAHVNEIDTWTTSYSRGKFADDELPHASIKEGTALHYACLTSNFNIIEDLLKAGADWKKKDKEGRLPIHLLVGADEGPEWNRFKDLCAKHGQAIDASEDLKRRNQDHTGGPSIDDTKENSPDASEETQPNEVEDTKPLEELFGEKIIGQRGPIHSVASAMRLHENGWVDPERPLVLLFLGSSGIGKTELAKQVAIYNHKKSPTIAADLSPVEIEKENGFIRLDMSEYQEKHTVSGLFGSPKGYVGYGDGGSLACKLKKSPKAVVLLDEIEKAHPDVLTVFLQVFGDGRITDTSGGVVYCQNAIFIMTSNAASDEIKKKSPVLRALADKSADRLEEYSRFLRGFNQEIYPILKKQFKRDEFLGRINQTIVFLPLNDEEIHQVINIELKTWRRRAAEAHGIILSWSSEVNQKLGRAYDLNFGVRSVVNEVSKVAVQLIAEAQIRGDLGKDFLAHLSLNEDGNVTMTVLDPKREVRQKRGCRLVAL